MPDIYNNKAPLLNETFLFRGSQGLPGTESLPEYFEIASGDWTTTDEKYLRATSPGELVYTGDQLNDIKLGTSNNANFSIAFAVAAIESLKFEIRGRRSDGDNYIALSVDFENKVFSIKQSIDGTETTIDSVSHTWHENRAIKYAFELRMYENRIEGLINGTVFVSGTSSHNIEEDGFSIFVPEVWEDQPTIFYQMKIHETMEYPEPQLESDPNDLYLVLRKRMQQELSQTPDGSWDTYNYLYKVYMYGKDIGRPDEQWAHLGYPIYFPNPEEWFQL